LAVDGPYLEAAARQTVAQIQSRLTGATPGQLALADGEACQLSLADDGPVGQVSLATEAEGEAEDAAEWPTDRQGGPSSGDGQESARGSEASPETTSRPPARPETD
jgi:hypothetical protein